ncbi:MAG: YjgN family protein [Massilia sp.]
MILELEEIAPPPAAPPASAPTPRGRVARKGAPNDAALAGEQAFGFTGSGGEYFRIWVVNLLLTILTLGIYSAWAKVRRLQYFYRNTTIAGASFNYHGNALAILKGRVLAVGLLAAWKFSWGRSVVASVLIATVLGALMPWLLSRSFRFKLINSSYRGLRLRFGGSVGDAYKALSLFPILIGVTVFFAWSILTSFSRNPGVGTAVLGVLLPLLVFASLVPVAHFFVKRYQHDNAYFGQTPFFFQGRTSDFFKIYGRAIGVFFLGSLSAGAFTFLTGRLFTWLSHGTFGWLFEIIYGMLSASAFYLFLRPFIESRIQNVVWNSTILGGHRFRSSTRARALVWIHASNLMLIMCTCGLYKPFATIRLVRYKVACMSLVFDDTVEEFLVNQAGDNAGALGQEAGDFFDVDIAL